MKLVFPLGLLALTLAATTAAESTASSLSPSARRGIAFAFTGQVFVAPLPLVTSGLDGEIGIRCVFHGNHGFGCGQCHTDHDQERHNGPRNFNFYTFVERS